jgi:hypothetical protein
MTNMHQMLVAAVSVSQVSAIRMVGRSAIERYSHLSLLDEHQIAEVNAERAEATQVEDSWTRLQQRLMQAKEASFVQTNPSLLDQEAIEKANAKLANGKKAQDSWKQLQDRLLQAKGTSFLQTSAIERYSHLSLLDEHQIEEVNEERAHKADESWRELQARKLFEEMPFQENGTSFLQTSAIARYSHLSLLDEHQIEEVNAERAHKADESWRELQARKLFEEMPFQENEASFVQEVSDAEQIAQSNKDVANGVKTQKTWRERLQEMQRNEQAEKAKNTWSGALQSALVQTPSLLDATAIERVNKERAQAAEVEESWTKLQERLVQASVLEHNESSFVSTPSILDAEEIKKVNKERAEKAKNTWSRAQQQ